MRSACFATPSRWPSTPTRCRPSNGSMRSAGGDDAYLRNTLRDVLQYQSLHRSISEAFR